MKYEITLIPKKANSAIDIMTMELNETNWKRALKKLDIYLRVKLYRIRKTKINK